MLTIFQFLAAFSMFVALAGMFVILVMNLFLAFNVFRGKSSSPFVNNRQYQSENDELRAEIRDLRASMERMRNDDWLRNQNKTT